MTGTPSLWVETANVYSSLCIDHNLSSKNSLSFFPPYPLGLFGGEFPLLLPPFTSSDGPVYFSPFPWPSMLLLSNRLFSQHPWRHLKNTRMCFPGPVRWGKQPLINSYCNQALASCCSYLSSHGNGPMLAPFTGRGGSVPQEEGVLRETNGGQCGYCH